MPTKSINSTCNCRCSTPQNSTEWIFNSYQFFIHSITRGKQRCCQGVFIIKRGEIRRLDSEKNFRPPLSFQRVTMSPTTPLASTLAIRDKITKGFKSYRSSKPDFALAALLLMLASVAGTCMHPLYFISEHPCLKMTTFLQKLLISCGDPAIFTDASITEPIFVVRQEYNMLNNSDNSITDPSRFKDVREFLQRSSLFVTPQMLKNAVQLMLLQPSLKSNLRSI